MFGFWRLSSGWPDWPPIYRFDRAIRAARCSSPQITSLPYGWHPAAFLPRTFGKVQPCFMHRRGL